MNLAREALEAARLELIDAGIPSPALEKVERAIAAIDDGQAVTTADVEAWASTADAFELGQAAFAIRKRIRAIGARLDEPASAAQ